MKHDKIIGVRIPTKLRESLERERRRASKAAGSEVKTSAIIRTILEHKLQRGRKTHKAAAAAR